MAKRRVTLKLGARKRQRADPRAAPEAAPETAPDVAPDVASEATEAPDAADDVPQTTTDAASDIDASQAQFTTLSALYADIVNGALTLKDEASGEVISGPFLKLPPKKLYPDYYDLIESPISINEIRVSAVAKRRSGPSVDGNGVSLDEFVAMWERMAQNAATYNDPDSLIVNDANVLLNYVTGRINAYKKYRESIDSKPEPRGKRARAAKSAKSDDTPSARRRASRSKPAEQEQEQEQEQDEEKDQDEEQEQEQEQEAGADAAVAGSEVDPHEKWKTRNPTKAEVAAYDDSNEDYTQDLMKVYKHLLSFKISHHKNSIPLAKILLDLPNRDDPATEDYYDIITEPMCFNMIGDRLDQGKYAQGTNGFHQFVDDVNLIFDNCLDVWAEGPYYKAATGLQKALKKRLDKFESQVINKRKIAAMTNTRETKKPSRSRDRNRKRNRKSGSENDNGDNGDDDDNDDDDDDDDEDDGNNNDEENQDGQLAQDAGIEPKVEMPSFIRKHDVEKASTVEEIDDITAFIQKFTICTTTNLGNFANTLRNINGSKSSPNTGSQDTNVNNLFIKSHSLYENVIYEPAGNSTVGGSSYIMHLPGNAVIGHEISCNVYLQNKIVDEKYISELLVNGETIKGIPMSITYDETSGDKGMFCAGKYALRLGYGLNYFEFNLKVPYPLKGRTEDVSEENVDKMELDEKRERIERGAERPPSQEFVEHIKIWLNVTR